MAHRRRVTFKQLIFDFGATRSEVERNRALIDSEKFKLADQAEDIALRTVNAFLNLLEQGELIRLIDQTVVQQRELANIVRLNQESGNGTKADLDHIQAKIIEIEALRTDIKTAHLTAMDEFGRLTGLRPQQVRRPSASKAMVPATVDMALNRARSNNPSMAAISAAGVALNHQLESTRAQRLPKLELQGEALNKHYQGARAFSNGVVDAKVLATLSFKLYDGGMLEAQTDRVRANVEANGFNLLDERETVELNLRRFYLTVASSRAKRAPRRRRVSRPPRASRASIPSSSRPGSARSSSSSTRTCWSSPCSATGSAASSRRCGRFTASCATWARSASISPTPCRLRKPRRRRRPARRCPRARRRPLPLSPTRPDQRPLRVSAISPSTEGSVSKRATISTSASALRFGHWAKVQQPRNLSATSS